MSTFSLATPHAKLHARVWAVPTPKAVLALVHGHGEHVERYGPVAEFLNEQGIVLLGADLIGHGKSPGKRGHFPSYEQVLDGIQALLDHAHQEYPETSVFLMGHSLGGNLVANFVLCRQPEIKGGILSSPWLRLAFKPSALDLWLARTMVNILPAFTQSSKLDAQALSRDPEEVKKYQADPLVHDLVSPKLFTEVVQAGEYALTHASAWSLPLLHYHGDADRITSFEASREFAAQAGGGDVTWRPWEGGYHELHNDQDRAAVLQALSEWILKRA